MISARSTLFSLLFASLSLLAAPPAAAQTHADGNLQVGGVGRIFSGSSKTAGVKGSIGPLVGLEGDVALVPLLRLGAYVDYEYADTGEPTPPTALSFGGRLKVMLPGYRHNVHWWLFAGFGGVVLEAPGYTQSGFGAPDANTAVAHPATGYFLEVPLGVGMGWRVRKPWEVVVQLQGRLGFDMMGSYFTDDGSGNGLSRPATGVRVNANGTTTTSPLAYSLPTGTDVLAVLLTVGIGFDD